LGKTLTGSYAYYQLTNPSLDPRTVASTGSISSLPQGIALYGSRALAWDVTNLGRITPMTRFDRGPP
jgi:hypothetical protein